MAAVVRRARAGVSVCIYDRGFPLATVIELDGVGLARDAWRLERQQRESLYALQAYTAQLDAYVGGGGDWATDGLDDDEYLDAPGAWHDGEALGSWRLMTS